jgi:hypothetical protein
MAGDRLEARMVITAFWKALYTAGHDAACLMQTKNGWMLDGTAVYLKNAAPAALNYRLQLASDWTTSSGSIKGWVGNDHINHEIRRDGDGWLLNGMRQSGLEGVVDLDFGFTPATNYAQVRRTALQVGASAEFTVAWMDVESARLEPLPQIYKRLSGRAYDYNSPQGPYNATLQLDENGFVNIYPDLWQMT